MSGRFVLKLALCVSLLLCGCSKADNGKGNKQSNVQDIADELVAVLNLQDEVETAKPRIVKGMLFAGDDVVDESAVYMPVDSTNCDIVGVFRTSKVKLCREYLQEWLTDRKEELEIYYPSQVFKISNAVLVNSRTTVILVVCENIEDAKVYAEKKLGN